MPEDNNEAYSLGSPATTQFTRRKFFSWLGFGSVVLALGGCGTGTVALLMPKTNYEPSTAFAVGRPSDYRPGDMKLLEAQRVFIFRSYWKNEAGETIEGFQALTSVCTHLGCSYRPFGPPDAAPHANGYNTVVHAHCPCHGSIFARDGTVLGGPAPRPLPFYQISLTPDGRLEVDRSKIVPPGQYKYLTPDGKWIDGPKPEGKDINFS